MGIFYLVLGIFILIGTVTDLIWTTLWVDGGAGPLSSRLTKAVWKTMKKSRIKNERVLSLAGPLILVLTLCTWVLLIWGGWTLIFAGQADSLIDTREAGPISWFERIYFVAYSLFTMGNGDFSPNGSIWQLATSLITGSGMLFLTLAASYIISVVSAVADKRAFASSVSGLGTQVVPIVKKMWNGEDFDQLNLLLVTFSNQLSSVTQQHKAYPLLHYYHSAEKKEATPVAVSLLDESLSIIYFGTTDNAGFNQGIFDEMRSTVGDYLETLHEAFIEPADHVPPLPELDALRQEGVPVLPAEAFEKNMAEVSERRRELSGAVRADSWQWPA
ncbi:Ion channel [Alkalibacterium subtropicum]|uniref:Ion channel n=1 Tax=Alkalibacterium subtropicum TaxID=753702 RepID=A0A1I1L5J6_9LACT|nr:potassium channel family protein [Alkalibacterium subtropicum]SFC67802.1 Ion channel [Alkalibacterium subtropicum]